MKCGAQLHLADDYRDNICTCKCDLEKGHSGPHEERFERDGHPVLIQFGCDDRLPPSEESGQ